MQRTAAVAFSSSSSKLLRWIPTDSKARIVSENPGKNGEAVVQAIKSLEADAEAKVNHHFPISLGFAY